MEILMGLVLIFFGGVMASKGTLTPFIVFAIFFANPILKRVKERYIFPRVGYVKLPQEEQTDTKGIGIAALVFVIFLVASLGISIWIMGADSGREIWMTYVLPPFTGLMMAIGPFWLGQTYGLVRGYVFAAIFLILGIRCPRVWLCLWIRCCRVDLFDPGDNYPHHRHNNVCQVPEKISSRPG